MSALGESRNEYNCPGFALLTNNNFYPTPKVTLPVKVKYNVLPNVVLYRDSEENKLFDGADLEAFGTVAWHAVEGEEVSAIIDLSKPMYIEKVLLIAGQELAHLPSVLSGNITTAISLDNKIYYPIAEEKLLKGRGDLKPFIYDDLGIQARFVKISMKAEKVSQHSVWSFAEIAIWGKP